MTKNTDTKVVTGKVRLSYCHLFQPHSSAEGAEPKYSCTILVPKSDKVTVEKIKKAVDAAKVAGVDKFGGKVPTNPKTSIHDGDGEKPSGEEYGPECKGHYVISCSSKTRPNVVDRDLNEVIDSNEVYSGCYGRVSINFYAYNTSGNKGIACGLNNVQKLADGEYLGGRSRAEDDFKDGLGDEEDDALC